MSKLVYLVQRSEMSLDPEVGGLDLFAEKVFASETAAKEYCLELDPGDKGFEYTCPCGCGDIHYRAWDVCCIAYEDEV